MVHVGWATWPDLKIRWWLVGLRVDFAEAFPAVPAASSVPSLTTSTSWARVAALLGVSSLDILDVTQANAKETKPKRKNTAFRWLMTLFVDL